MAATQGILLSVAKKPQRIDTLIDAHLRLRLRRTAAAVRSTARCS
jgi:hypothetical protein